MNREKREKGRKTRKEVRAEIAEGCCEMRDVMLEIEKEWHPLEEEVARMESTDEEYDSEKE